VQGESLSLVDDCKDKQHVPWQTAIDPMELALDNEGEHVEILEASNPNSKHRGEGFLGIEFCRHSLCEFLLDSDKM
jgi:hypothetical protein